MGVGLGVGVGDGVYVGIGDSVGVGIGDGVGEGEGDSGKFRGVNAYAPSAIAAMATIDIAMMVL